MSLIRDIATLRRYVKISYTQANEKNLPDIGYAEREFLIPVLGLQLFTTLNSKVGLTDLSDEWKQLLDYSRAAVGPLAVWLELPFMQAAIEDGGIKTTKSEFKEASHQWEYAQIEQALLEKGMKALDFLLDFLPLHKDVFAWQFQGEKTFIRSGKELSKYCTISQPNLTFQLMLPLMTEVEDHFIRPAISDEFFDYLNNLESFENKLDKEAAILIKKTIAQYLVARAVERLPVKITRNGLLATLENSSAKEMNASTLAKDSQLLTLQNSANRDGDAYFLQLIEFLNANASGQIFKEFFNSTKYKGVVTQSFATDINNSMTGVVRF